MLLFGVNLHQEVIIMTNYLEILRLNSLGISKSVIAESLGYSRTTVITTINRAEELNLHYPEACR